MKLNWHTIGAALLSVLSWASINVNWSHVNPKVATIVGVVTAGVAAFSKPAVQKTGG